jgi:Right handed beta helix region
MSSFWPTELKTRVAIYALGVAAVLTVVSPFMRILRTKLLDRLPTFYATTGADSGPGSLRAAIFEADRAQDRARVIVSVPAVTLSAPLPPIVNPKGIVFESRGTAARIDGTGVTGAVVDIAAPDTVVSNLRIVGGRVGVIVRGARATLNRIVVEHTDVAVFIGANASDVHVEESLFASNRIGLQISGSDGSTRVQGSRFEKHRDAGVWATSVDGSRAARLAMIDNRFREGARGMVVVGLPAEIERNWFDQLDGDAVHATAARVIVKDNRMRSGLGFGLYLQHVEAARVERNEIAYNCAGGIMVRAGTNAQVERNEIYQNGHGIVVMEGEAAMPNSLIENLVADDIGDGLVLIGAMAIVSGNRVLRNRQVGIHFSTLQEENGRPNTGRVLLERNVVAGNGRDEEHDIYRPSSEPAAATAVAGCGWRQGVAGLVASAGAAR